MAKVFWNSKAVSEWNATYNLEYIMVQNFYYKMNVLNVVIYIVTFSVSNWTSNTSEA